MWRKWIFEGKWSVFKGSDGLQSTEAPSYISSDSSWLPRGGGETYVEGHDFNDFILKGEDSWLVIFLPHQPGEQSKKRRTNLSALWDLVAQQLHTKISVGFAMVPLDVWNHPGWAKEMRLTPEEYWDSAVEDESTPQRMRLTRVRLHLLLLHLLPM